MLANTATGAVELNYNNSKKLETTTTGISVTGQVNASTMHLTDGNGIHIGNSNDLQIYHNGTDSYVSDTATGSLILTGNRVIVKNAADNARMIDATEGGSVKLIQDLSLIHISEPTRPY